MSRYRLLALVAAVVAVVAFAHGPALGAGFVAFDDDQYVYANAEVLKGLTVDSIGWAFRLDHPRAYYHPLTWLSLMLDVSVFGTKPMGFHLVNVLLHGASAVILLLVLLRTTRLAGPSICAASIFAAHPLTVEVVAWVTERKAALSTLLLLGAIWAYVRYVEARSPRRLALVLALVAAGVLSKPAAVVAPALMLILDFWPLRRLEGLNGSAVGWPELRRAVIEKLPTAGVALASFVPSLASIRFLVREGPQYEWPMGLRLENALSSIPSYLAAAVWPSRLSVYRLFPEQIAVASLLAAGAMVVLISILALRTARRWPYLLAGWGWFLAALVPYLGIVRAGLWPAWADRFAYLPLIGLAIAVSFGVHSALTKVRQGPRIGAALAVAAVACLGVTARAQGAHWQDSIALFGRGAAMEPGSYVMNFGLAAELAKAGRLQESVAPFEAALRIYPTSAAAHAWYASVLVRLGRPVDAAVHFQEALRLEPANAMASFGYAELLSSRGMGPAARAVYREFVRVAPEGPERAEAMRRAGE